MDFPLKLNANSTWVYGIEELKQNIYALLKDPIGSFMQDVALGAQFSVHASSNLDLEEGIRATLEQIPYIKINSISANIETDSSVDISIEYNKETINFQYNIEL